MTALQSLSQPSVTLTINDAFGGVVVTGSDFDDLRNKVAHCSENLARWATASPLSTADSASGSEGRPASRKRRQPGGENSGVDAGKDDNGAEKAGAEAPAAEAAATEETPEPIEGAAASDSAEEKAPANDDTAATYDDVRNAVVGLAAAKGRDAAIAVLDQFGVDHASKLSEAQWPEALAALTDAQGAA